MIDDMRKFMECANEESVWVFGTRVIIIWLSEIVPMSFSSKFPRSLGLEVAMMIV